VPLRLIERTARLLLFRGATRGRGGAALRGQYSDLDGAALRILSDDDV
jgi:hypothetical protein